MELSKRMQAVADMVPAGHVAADVGCDHGFVSIYLVKYGICPHVYAADVRPGPLSRARQHIAQSGLEAYITTVLSDGLKEVPVKGMDEPGDNGTDSAQKSGSEAGRIQKAVTGADGMIAAGIGGKLTIRILSDVPEKTEKLSWLVLEPQSEVWLVRRWLLENGFVITNEELILEDGKYYPVIFAQNAGTAEDLKEEQAAGEMSEAEWKKACDWFGPVLIQKKSPVLLSFLEHTIEKDAALLSDMLPEEKNGKTAERRMRRMDDLKERIALAAQVRDMLKE